jgi:hypothetical protein
MSYYFSHTIPVGTRVIVNYLNVSHELEGEKGVVREHLNHLISREPMYSVRLDNDKQIQERNTEKLPWSYARIFSENELIVDPNQEVPVTQTEQTEKKPWWKIF